MTRNEILSVSKPILFNTEMVRAILDGRKTVTRRIAKFLGNRNPNWTGYVKDGNQLYNGTNEPCLKNPAYQKGEYMYVRETWTHLGTDEQNNPYLAYKARAPHLQDNMYIKWHPSIHMPKEAARILLRVTDVRVERLQDITEEQAVKEGAMYLPINDYEYAPAVFNFAYIWNSTIMSADLVKYGWDANPWVWVYEFERVMPD